MDTNRKRTFFISVVSEQGDIEWDGGLISFGSMQNLVNKAEKVDFVGLGLIDLSGDTYFGEKQCAHICKEEIPALRMLSNVDTKILDLVEQGCRKVMDDSWSYLKISSML